MPPKRSANQDKENDAFTVFTPERPPTQPAKRPRRSLPNLSSEELQAQWEKAKQERAEKEKREEAAHQEATAAAEAARAEEEAIAAGLKLRAALSSLKDHGFETINEFITALHDTKDPHLLSTITKLVDRHGTEHLEAMQTCSPHLVQQWALGEVMTAVHNEGRCLSQEAASCSSIYDNISPLIYPCGCGSLPGE